MWFSLLLVMFHLICVWMKFSYVYVAWYHPFRKELLIRLTVGSLCNMSYSYFLLFPHFGFEGRTVGLTAPVSGHCLTFLLFF